MAKSANIQYREATDEDIPQILAAIKAAHAEYVGLFDPPTSEEQRTVEKIKKELQEATAVVADHNHTIIGSVFFRCRDDGLHLNRLSVLPDWRGQEIGRQLLEIVEGKTAEMGLKKVTLSIRVNLSENEVYFQKLGYEFAAYGSHEGYTEPTYMLLAKQL
jgi:predicted N-acetyltransferase YhbS